LHQERNILNQTAEREERSEKREERREKRERDVERWR
jgi:hypothetical protein